MPSRGHKERNGQEPKVKANKNKRKQKEEENRGKEKKKESATPMETWGGEGMKEERRIIPMGGQRQKGKRGKHTMQEKTQRKQAK